MSVISVRNIGKEYHLGAATHNTLRDHLAALFRRREKTDTTSFWALSDISFDVEQGEVVGIIGRNGAGKSTLLKILSQITEPTTGEVRIRGRVASLLEVGTGFHPELSGRENIFLNGSILGMSRREITAKFDEIVAFAEVEKFIDTPVKHYSSGMYVRLAFAVAAHLDPEILIVDEVLAVGDAMFQAKCLGKMNEVAKRGRTVLFVSHNITAIRGLCQRGILLDSGRRAADGPVGEIVAQYLTNPETVEGEWRSKTDAAGGPLHLRAVRVKDQDGTVRGNFTNHDPITVEMEIDIREWVERLKVGFEMELDDGEIVFASYHNDRMDLLAENSFTPGIHVFSTVIPRSLLNGLAYYISPVATVHRQKWLFREQRLVRFNVQFQIDNPAFFVKRRDGLVCPLLDWNVKPQPAPQPCG